MRNRSSLRALPLALLAGCLPSQFDDLSSNDQENSPSMECAPNDPDCPELIPDAGPAPSDAAVARDAGTPPKDAGTLVDAGPKDAGVVDASPPPPSNKDWPPATEAVEPTPHMGCVYIEFCTHPETGGAVCRLHSGCQINASTRTECRSNLETCGTPPKPIFFCDRASKTCVTP